MEMRGDRLIRKGVPDSKATLVVNLYLSIAYYADHCYLVVGESHLRHRRSDLR